MYKLTSLFLFLLFISCSQQQCTDFSCVTEGMKCTGDFTSLGIIFDNLYTYDNNARYCSSGYYCHRDQQKCIKLGQEGEACYQNYCNGTQPCSPVGNGCLPGLSCYRQSIEAPATCQYLQYLMIGEECSTSLQCAYTLECNQSSGLCEISQKFRDLMPSGVECLAGLHCQGGQYCGNGKCLNAVGVGQNCTDPQECQYGTTCNNQICTVVMSKGEGSSCEDAYDLCDISENFYCNDNTLECTKLSSLVQGDCSDSSIAVCENGQKCLCSSSNRTLGQCESVATSNLGQCKTAFTSFYTCLKDNNSPLLLSGINIIAKDSVGMKNCYQNFCNIYTSCTQYPGSLGMCNNDPILNTICSAVSSSPSNFLPSINLFLFILFIIPFIL
ncbi:hypothetical protein DLAC_10668 [Tieghemostelium lacteum]|uniref:DUF7107 domain-containing protein n=1 Tax=Tieghemostelium lacteum TaxID=361077 RepID=A0A151Z4Z0_TIELA|nr:hypothetical protein DLAC_10668 [Tieghemostelium lacteum]|eukprot:KYQ88864.1 hypothetical protein DLAC_10668 [Tieghemostelium lacteum]